MPSSSRNWVYDGLLLFVVLVWGVNFPILKAALAVMHPHVVNIFRFTVSALVLGGMYTWSLRGVEGGFFQPLRTHGRQLIVLGLLGYVVYQISFIIGVHHTTAGSAALIMASSPLWTAIVGRVTGYEQLGRLAWIGLFVSLVGTGLVVASGASSTTLDGGSLYGNMLMLGAAVIWGLYTAYNKPIVRDLTPISVAFMGILVALPFLFGIGIPYLPTIEWTAVDAWVWVAIVFSGGLSTGIAFVIWATAIKNVGASNTAVYGNLVPFVALLGGALLLDEAITWAQIGGGVMIIAGLLIMRRDRRRIPATADRAEDRPHEAAA